MTETLFLKYRPQTFDDIVGQESTVRTIKNSLKVNKPVHAYLFSGSRGTGKTSMARILAKGLICENLQDGSPCGKCQMCQDIAQGKLIDVIEIDAASNRGIDEIRDLREKVKFSPNFAKRKVYIIDEVHMLTKDASNALLKTLEEPPEHAYFVLATTELHKILDTIISRCQTFIFGRFTIEQLVDRLEKICQAEKIKYEESALELIAKKAEGGLRDAISALDQISAESDGNITAEIVRRSLGISSSELLENFYSAIEEKNPDKGLDVLRTVSQNGFDFRTFGHDFLGFMREKMFEKLKSGKNLSLVINTIEETETALARLKNSPITELPLEIALIKLCASKPHILTEECEGETEKPTKSQIKRDKQEEKTSRNSAISPRSNDDLKEVRNKSDQREDSADSGDFVFDDEKEIPAKNSPKKTPIIAEKEKDAVDKENFSLTAQKIREKMSEIAQKSGIPVFVKKSFLTTSPQIKGNKITFCAQSTFHYEQISSEKIRGLLSKSASEIFGHKVIVECSRGPASSKPVEKIATSDDLVF